MSDRDVAAAPLAAELYSPQYVSRLFDEMAGTYGVVNVLSSFGFCVRWRRQCAQLVNARDAAVVYDFMSGMGELWTRLERAHPKAAIVGVDFSPVMCSRARAHAARKPNRESPIIILEEDVLGSALPDASADVIVSSFGLKTFSPAQHVRLATQLARLLKPGGQFALLEISVPSFAPLRWPYMFYLNHVVPCIGRLLLGNPDNYRMLGRYTRAFGDCRSFAVCCADAGLETEVRRLFFGCASAVVGRKRKSPDLAAPLDP